MTNLEIVDSGVAQCTKQDKLLYRQKMGLATFSLDELARVVRSSDQDKYVRKPKRGIFAVADGVGGELFGAEAAQAACDAFYDELRADDHEFATNHALTITSSRRTTARYILLKLVWRVLFMRQWPKRKAIRHLRGYTE